MASAVASPFLIVARFVAWQRSFIAGLTAGAVKA
jgi:ABC-type glycerol-3-phosphate transport system permease component